MTVDSPSINVKMVTSSTYGYIAGRFGLAVSLEKRLGWKAVEVSSNTRFGSPFSSKIVVSGHYALL